MTDLQMAAKFREAADHLRRYGWRPNHWGFGNPSAAQCVLGACVVVGLQIPTPLYEHLRESGLGRSLTDWNDVQASPEPVLALLETVAHDLELRHQIVAQSTLPAASRHDATIPSLEAVPVA